ncbi:MAG: hypothetical protein WD335_03360 [Candidatus Paceibacterota bacterium]
MNKPKTIEKYWIELSHEFADFNQSSSPDPHIMARIQNLGRFDADLIHREQDASLNVFQSDPYKLNNLVYHSYLWIVDANEILRILKTFGNKDEYNSLYQEIREVRIPLAKHEKMNDNYKYGFFALPILERNDNKVGWRYGERSIFYRTDFSAKMLETFRNILN